VRFVKGHGTENDFVLLPDPDGILDLTPVLIRALCDRRAGLGADGILRVVRSEHAPAGAPERARAPWFMDYYNADGTTAEMCGNGIRLYARYLVEAGLAAPGSLRLGTRSGVREVRLAATGDVTVEMGAARITGPASAAIDGESYDGVRVDMGNPHLVCLVDRPLADYDLTSSPAVSGAAFPDGVNVELVSVVSERHLAMRVHERGVGETRSCGTGACAVAVAMAARSGADRGEWTVDVPGGRLGVVVGPDAVWLRGPAVIVGAGVIDAAWLAAASGSRPGQLRS